MLYYYVLSLHNKENPLIKLLLDTIAGRHDSFGRKGRKWFKGSHNINI